MIRMLIVAFAALLGPAAAAQSVSDKEMREIQARYGECVVKKHHSEARTFVLDSQLPRAEYRRMMGKLVDGPCLERTASGVGRIQMRFPLDTMRYALADALVRREFAAMPPAGIEAAGALAPLRFNPAAFEPKPGQKATKTELEELARDRDRSLAMAFLAEYGECVVRANTADSRRLLLTDPATPAESAAFTSLAPQMGNCLTGVQKVSLNKTALRGAIALNYYRLAHAPRVAAAAGVTR